MSAFSDAQIALIEIFNRVEQLPRLVDDDRRALAVIAVRGAKILAIDDLGETDDRIERGPDFMNQLTQRRRVERSRRGDDRRRGECLGTAGDPAIADEAAVAGRERRHAADQPASGDDACVG